MAHRKFLPKGFAIPHTEFQGQYCIRPLSMDDAVTDFACYMSCVDYIREGGFIQPTSMPFIDFPRHDMTLRDAIILLAVAEYEMSLGHRIEYGIFNKNRKEELGCLYVMPSMKEGFDAQVTFWIREDRAAEIDAPFLAYVKEWVPDAFPHLEKFVFPGRDMTWDDWAALPNARF